MRSEQRNLVVPAAVSAVYDFLIDYTHDCLWRDELVEVRLISGTPGLPGAVYETVNDWNGVRSRARIQLVDCEQPHRIHFRLKEPGSTVDSVYRLEPEGDGTKLQVEFTLDSKGGLLLVEPFSWAILTRWADAALPRLADAIVAWSQSPEAQAL